MFYKFFSSIKFFNNFYKIFLCNYLLKFFYQVLKKCEKVRFSEGNSCFLTC